MAATITVQHDPYSDGLGKASQLGVAFLRKVRIDCVDDATPTVLNADIGAQKIIGVQSIVMRTAHSCYVDDADLTATGVTFTASDAAAKFDAYLLCQGL